jgi:hypothetical protein
MAGIKIETGLKTYDIEDENGNVRGQISFNPSDINLYPRAQAMQEHIKEYIKELTSINENEVNIVNEFDKVDKLIKSEINTLFDDENASKVVFGNQSALSSYKGVTFVERFLLAFMPIIQKEAEAEFKKSMKHIEKYTKQVE